MAQQCPQKSSGLLPVMARVAATIPFIGAASICWSGACKHVCSAPRGCVGSSPMLFLVQALGTSWNGVCVAGPGGGGFAFGPLVAGETRLLVRVASQWGLPPPPHTMEPNKLAGCCSPAGCSPCAPAALPPLLLPPPASLLPQCGRRLLCGPPPRLCPL